MSIFSRPLNPLPWLSAKSRAAYEFGKSSQAGQMASKYLAGASSFMSGLGAGASRLMGTRGLGAAAGRFSQGYNQVAFGNTLKGDLRFGAYGRNLMGQGMGNLGRGFGNLGRWATGSGYRGLGRVGAAAARLGPLAAGAWGINRLRD